MTSEENYLFNCTTNSLPHISAVLNGLPSSIKKLYFVANSDGISFVAEEDRVTLIEVFFENTLFSAFSLREDYEEIRVSLDNRSLIECLNIASKETNQISIFLKELGDDLVLIYQDTKIVEKCQLRTYADASMETGLDLEIGDDCEWEITITDGALFFDFLKDFKDLLSTNIYFCLNDYSDLYIVGVSESGSTLVYKLPSKFIDVLIKTEEIIHFKDSQIFNVLKMFKSITRIKIVKAQHLIKFQIFSNQLINSLSSYKDTLINITMMRSDHEFIENTILKAISIENEEENNLVEEQGSIQQQQPTNGITYYNTTFNNTYPVGGLERTHSNIQSNLEGDVMDTNDDFDVPAFL